MKGFNITPALAFIGSFLIAGISFTLTVVNQTKFEQIKACETKILEIEKKNSEQDIKLTNDSSNITNIKDDVSDIKNQMVTKDQMKTIEGYLLQIIRLEGNGK